MRSGLLLLAAFTLAAGKGSDIDQEDQTSVWISQQLHPSVIEGRPVDFHNAHTISLQRLTFGALVRDKHATRFTVPPIGQYLVRVRAPVRKGLAAELRALAAGTVRYLPHDTFTAVLPESALSLVTQLDGVVELYVRPAQSKVSQELSEQRRAGLQRRREDSQGIVVVAQMVSMSDSKDSQNAIENVAADLGKALGKHVPISVSGRETLEVVVADMAQMNSIVSILAEHPLVQEVLPDGVLYPFSLLASEAVQSGSGASGHRVFDKGLLGDGEIVAVLDSGCDYDMAFFVDPSESIATCGANVQTQWTFDNCVNLDHRKIVSYRFTESSTGHVDITEGHGTHVASTLAGHVDGYIIDGTGACPNCKLVIDDLDGDSSAPITYWVGSNFHRLMQHSYNAGARIHSISAGKGQGSNFYGNGAQGFDEFLHDNDDSLVVTAAGNYGAGNAEFSVVDPATSKNALSVGMTFNARPSVEYNEDGTNGGSRIAFGANSSPESKRLFVQFRGAEWEAFRGATPHRFDRWQWDFSDTSAELGSYYAAPRMEVREVSWGRRLGNNEVVEGPLVALEKCMCDGEVPVFPYTKYPTEPWTLLVLWDWGYDASQCDNDCTSATAWDNIMYMFNTHNMRGLILIEPKCTQGFNCNGVAADADQWFILRTPPGISDESPAPFPVGQVMQEATALQAYIGGDWQMYYSFQSYNFYYYAGYDPSYWTYFEKGNNPYGFDETMWTENMHVVWPHDRRSTIFSLSSRGPTLDLRFAPDIMCPGGDSIRAASSDGSSTTATPSRATTLKTGTSMATPVCAGGAALIRQYLREGWYGDGTMGSAAAISSPSGALIKAMMINSAQPVYGTEVKAGQWPAYFLFDSFPNFHGGFGRLSLDHVMMFDDSAFNLRFGERIAVEQFGVQEFCVSVTEASQPLVVTIAWMDPAAEQQSLRALVNDLDLVVVSEAGDFHYGNNIMWTDEVNTAGRPVRDSRNNVEKVKINVPTVGKYSIRIVGADVPDGPQNVAYAMTGIFSDASGECEPLSACENDCSGHGTCVTGSGVSSGCVCDATHSGTDCSFQNQELTADTYVIELEPTSTSLYTIDASGGCFNLEVEYEVTQGQADVLIAESVHPVDYGSAATPSVGLNADAGCLQHASYRVRPSDGLQTATISSATQAAYVMSVTAFAGPDGGESQPTTIPTIATARVTKTAASACPATLCPGASAGSDSPVTTPAPTCPAQDATYAGCELAKPSWEEVTALQISAPDEVKTGGLGSRAIADECEAWICLPSTRVASCPSLAAGEWLCFWFDEQSEQFVPWGLNTHIEAF